MRAPRFNPFPGLRPFTLEERPLFFGREAQVAEVLTRLRQHRFLAVVGSSGSGKSSLVHAGLLPELHGGTMRAAGSAWRVVSLRPGGDPTSRLAQALGAADLHGADGEEHQVLRVKVTLERSGRGLVEAVRQAALPPRTNVLVLVDQFEELFRYPRDTPAARDAAAAFVRLLLEAARQTEVPLYVVLTMRSDFLGDCAQFAGLAEAVNQSEYLVPRLTRDQWRAAIEGPVRVGGGAIAPRLVQRLLNDVGDDPDQLPLLQHALMRTWDQWTQTAPNGQPLDLDHYEAVGTLHTALSRHADETYAQLPDPAARDAAARVFRALTEKSADPRGTRRPTRLGDLAAITGAGTAVVRAVTEAFRQEGRAFLMPPPEVALEPDTVVDLTHESLMRTWDRLRRWCDEEAVSVRIYRRLAETALLWQESQAGLFRDPDLEIARRWREENQPTTAWARRQAPGFEVALRFLDASIQARDADAAAREAARQRELEQVRAQAENERLRAQVRIREAQRRLWLVIALAVLALAMAAAFLAHRNSRKARAHQLAVQSATALPADPELGVLLATHAWTAFPSADALTLLRKTLLAWPLQLQVTQHAAPVLRATFSPDGHRFATADDEGGLVLTATPPFPHAGSRETVTPRALDPPHAGKLVACQFARTGRFLLSAAAREVRVWDTHEARLAAEYRPITGTIASATFTAGDERVLIATDDGPARLWTWGGTQAGEPAPLPLTGGRPRLAVASPQGQWLAVASDPNPSQLSPGSVPFLLHVLRSDGTEPRPLEGHRGDVRSLAFSADDRLLAVVGREGVVRLWETASGRWLAATAESAKAGLRHLVFGRQHLLAWGDQHLQVYATNGLGSTAFAPPWLPTHELPCPQGIRAAALSPDETMLLTAGLDGKVGLHLATGEWMAEFTGHQAQVNAVDWSPDGRWLLSGGHDGRASLWENRAGQFLAPPEPASLRLLAAGAGATRVLGPTAPPERRLRLRAPTLDAPSSSAPPESAYEPAAEVLAAAFSEDGRFLALGEESEITVLDTAATPPRASWGQPHPSAVRALAFAPGTPPPWVAVAGEDALVRIWTFQPGQPGQPGPREFRASASEPFERLGFSPDGRRLFGQQHGDAFTVWAVADGTRLAEFRQRGARCAAFDPTGRFLAVGCDSGMLWLWQLQPLRPVDRHFLHRGQINHLAWSRTGRFLASAGADKTARISEVTEVAEPGGLSPFAVLTGHPEPLLHVSFADGEQGLQTADLRGGLRHFRLGEVLSPDPPTLLQAAARRLTRGLDPEERRLYLRR